MRWPCQHNEFLVNPGSGYQLVFDSATAGQGDTRVFNLPAGTIQFEYIAFTSSGQVTVPNNSLSAAGQPGFFAGVDPYRASEQHQLTTGPFGTVYLGLTDAIAVPPTESDHDFQDLTVQMTAVPEPASLIMGSTAAVIVGLGVVWSRRRKRAGA